MEAKKFIGYCDCSDLPFVKGSKVTLRKGTKFTSTRKPGVQVVGRTYTVTVFDVYSGCDSYTNFQGEIVPARNPSIEWVGAGGYWHRADVNDLIESGCFDPSSIKPEVYSF